MPESTDSITRQDLADLLAAIRTVLDVPHAAHREDEPNAARVLWGRAAYVRGAIGHAASGVPSWLPATTSAVYYAADDVPVTYTPLPPLLAAELDEQRHQLFDPAVPPLAVPGPALPAPAGVQAAAGQVVTT